MSQALAHVRTWHPVPRAARKWPLAKLIVPLAYAVGTLVGFSLTPSPRPIATLWPPNAILLSALLLTSRRKWWVLILAVLPAHLAVQGLHGVPLRTSLGWFLGNAGEALIAAFCIDHFNRERPSLFSTVRGVLIFIAFGVFFAPLVSSFEDAAVVVFTGFGQGYWLLWTTRLFSNMLATLTFVPTIVEFLRNDAPGFRKIPPARWAEAALLALAITSLSFLVFGSQDMLPNTVPALVYAPLPILLWAAVRFRPSGLCACLLCVSIVSLLTAMHGRGPFTSASTLGNVLALQVLLCSIGLPLLILSAVMVERQGTAESLRAITHDLIGIQEQERQRIARELHDDIGQRLALIQIEVEMVRKRSQELGIEEELGKVYTKLSEVSRSIHNISHGLHPTELEYLGLGPAIDALCRNVGVDTGLTVEFSQHLIPQPIVGPLSLCLFRVAQESLHNTAKHGKATHVHVSLHSRAGRVLLNIVDDGIGFDPVSHPNGLGLISMRERLIAVGGALTVTSNPGGGAMILASAPIESASFLAHSA